MKILLATDNSDPAKRAADFVRALPLKTPPEVTVAHIVEDRDVPARVGMHPGWARVVDSLVTDAKSETAATAKLFEGWASNVETVVEKGHAADTVTSLAEQSEADLVVIGAIGHSPVRRLMLGSVSDRVATHAEAATLVVRPTQESEQGKLKILIGFDGSPKAAKAVNEVVSFFDPESIEVTLIAVVQEIGTIAAEYAEAATAAWQETREAIKTAVETQAVELTSTGVETNFIVAAADQVGDEICDRASDFDIVVVGDQGHDAIARFVLGSVSRYVLRHCEKSVWIHR